MPEIPVLGQTGTNNPLLILAEQLQTTNAILAKLEMNTRPELRMLHEYTVTAVNDEGGHGRMWGTFCIACSNAAQEYIYPCRVKDEEVIKLPAFFTIDGVFAPDGGGRMVRMNNPV